jgi:molybdate transport system substrate-binding protein
MFLLACSSEPTLTIATAANMQSSMEEITGGFEQETGIQTFLIVSSSGALSTQIEQGAPYDVFIGADSRYTNELYNKGLTTSKPEVYAIGQLVLWSNTGLIPTIDILTSDKVDKIAIANPKTAPYGVATIEVLKNIGIYKSIQNKLVYGESISQCNHFIKSGAAQIGFTSLSTVLDPNIEGAGKWMLIDQELHGPINQSAVVLKRSSLSEEAKRFYDYMFSESAQGVMEKYGYLIPADDNTKSEL